MKLWKGVLSGVTALSVVGGMAASGAPIASARDSIQSGQTITLWSWAGGTELTQVKKLAAEWGKLHGDTVTVVDQSNNANGFQFYATAARTGKGPDVLFGMPHDNNGTFAQEGLLAPVPAGAINPKDYSQSVIDAVTIQGKQYSLPVSVQTTALFYNKAKVKTPPTNWAQFTSDATKYGFGYDQANLYFDYFLVGGMGGYVFKNNNGTLDPNNIGLASPGAVSAFSLMHDMVAKYHWMTPTTTGAIAKQQFLSKKINMYISGAWDTTDIAAAHINYGIAPLPKLPNGHAATPFMGVITEFVNSRSASQDADWSLAEFLSSKQAQLAYFNVSQQIPALTALQKSPTVQHNALFKAFASEISTATPMPNIPQMQAVWSAMSVITNIIQGKVSPKQGAQDFVNNVKKGIQLQG